jgi:hypothetical protein
VRWGQGISGENRGANRRREERRRKRRQCEEKWREKDIRVEICRWLREEDR